MDFFDDHVYDLISLLIVLMSPRKRRDRLSIMAEILSIAGEGTLKTQIMYRANLSFRQLEEYLGFLKEVGLLGMNNTEDGRTTYKRTSKGNKYLENFANIKDLLKKDGSKEGPHRSYFL